MLAEIGRNAEHDRREREARRRSLQDALANAEGKLSELAGLRLRNLLTDAEFLHQRQVLQQEQLRLQHKLADSDAGDSRFEHALELFSFGNKAAEWFRAGDDQQKRLILETIGSNLSLQGKQIPQH